MDSILYIMEAAIIKLSPRMNVQSRKKTQIEEQSKQIYKKASEMYLKLLCTSKQFKKYRNKANSYMLRALGTISHTIYKSLRNVRKSQKCMEVP